MHNNDLGLLTWIGDKLWIALFAAFGWMWKRTTSNEKATVKVKDSLANHKLHLAENYMPKDDFHSFKKEISGRFDRLEDLIRGKQ